LGLTEFDLAESDAALTTKSSRKVHRNSVPKPIMEVTFTPRLLAPKQFCHHPNQKKFQQLGYDKCEHTDDARYVHVPLGIGLGTTTAAAQHQECCR